VGPSKVIGTKGGWLGKSFQGLPFCFGHCGIFFVGQEFDQMWANSFVHGMGGNFFLAKGCHKKLNKC
jgi:hypothetical protein